MSKIMIVDSDVTVQMDLEEYFEESHHHLVGIAETDTEAVSVARKTRPDIILVEIDLPGETNGIDIAESIQTQMDGARKPGFRITVGALTVTLAPVSNVMPVPIGISIPFAPPQSRPRKLWCNFLDKTRPLSQMF